MDISNNSDHIKLPWDATTPFEMLIDQIKECIKFADAGSLPFTVVQILSTAYNLVFNMSSFFDDCKKWNACTDNEKTWDNFKTHFLQVQNELQLQQQTAQTSGYHLLMWHTPTSNQTISKLLQMHWPTLLLLLQAPKCFQKLQQLCCQPDTTSKGQGCQNCILKEMINQMQQL